MNARIIDRPVLRAETRRMLETARVSPKGMTALYLGILLAADLLSSLVSQFVGGVPGTFFEIFSMLLSVTLSAGFALYCMAIRRNQRVEYLSLFDGFSFVGKLIGLTLLINLLIFLWSMLFMIPGIIAAYRYRFAPYYLYENPGLSIMEALEFSKQQTRGYKGQLFVLDLSFLGWLLLAALPGLIFAVPALVETLQLEAAALGMLLPQLPTFSIGAPVWVTSLISGLWSVAVQLFYLPTYQCMELAYYDAAKETAGFRPSEDTPEDDSL